MSRIPNNIHIIYGLAENFGWNEYEHYVQEVSKHIIDRIKIKDKSKITLRNMKI